MVFKTIELNKTFNDKIQHDGFTYSIDIDTSRKPECLISLKGKANNDEITMPIFQIGKESRTRLEGMVTFNLYQLYDQNKAERTVTKNIHKKISRNVDDITCKIVSAVFDFWKTNREIMRMNEYIKETEKVMKNKDEMGFKDIHNELLYSPALQFYKNNLSNETKQFFNLN